MVELWVPITIVAALFQTLRTALQKQLNVELSTNATTFTRYVYGFPLAALYVGGLVVFAGLEIPELNATFVRFCVIGGIAQIIATSALISLFRLRNFAVGTTYSKTEAIQAALFGTLILGETVGSGGLAAILISLAGVLLLSWGASGGSIAGFFRDLGGKAVLFGLLSGGMFGVSAVSIRAAALSLGDDHFAIRAGITVATMTLLQTVMLTVYLFVRERPQLIASFTSWRRSSLVGLLSVLGSIGWFSAMTLQNAAYVRTLGQIEMVFVFAVSHFYFRERTKPAELAGIALIVGGIVVLLNLSA